jgi:putative PEP-CTERM system histidine kinase
MFFPFVSYAAGTFSLLLAFASVVTRKPTLTRWCFFAGMVTLGIDSLLTGQTLRATGEADLLRWLTWVWIVKSFVPAAWLTFTLKYSRSDLRESLGRWRLPTALAASAPIGLALGFHRQLFELVPAGTANAAPQIRLSIMAEVLNMVLLVTAVWILMNLEQTFRAAAGTTRWRIKFVVLGLLVIFGAHFYVRSEMIALSAYDLRLLGVESSALLIGCVFLTVAYARAGLAEIDLYPSQAVLRSSLTILIGGSYLFLVGVVAYVVGQVGGAERYELLSLAVLVGMGGLTVVLLSDRLRQRVHDFVSRHFTRAQHDSARIWTEFSRRLAKVRDQAELGAASAKLVSETFGVLSVTVWLLDEQKEQLLALASTAAEPGAGGARSAAASGGVIAGLQARSSPFDLDQIEEPWAEELRLLNPATFAKGGHRWCVPLRAGEQCFGALVLADRVGGAGYTPEQLQLLQCIADQMTSVLLNLRLANEVARAREWEAFRTMSAFFVHDLKNAAASLNLMLKNLRVHFDDPAFREDALRGLGNTSQRIDEMIGRLSALRQQRGLRVAEVDLNKLVNEALDRLGAMPGVELTRELQPLPRILADQEQLQSVVTNLVLNARDALRPGGRIQIRTELNEGRAVLSVSDNGCGMSAEFIKDSLFQPFRSTKKQGLGLGMFQSRVIVEAHGGGIRVESEPGKGSTFRVSLPVKDGK